MNGFICTTQPILNCFTDEKFSFINNKNVIINGDITLIYSGNIYEPVINMVDIIPMYVQEGRRFVEALNGEFSFIIIDYNKGRVLLYTDTFNTKLLFYSIHNGFLYIGSRKSNFNYLKVKNYELVPISSIVEISLLDYSVIDIAKHSLLTLNENVDTYDDCILALENSIHIRYADNIGIGLSSGHDSGAILQTIINSKKNDAFFYFVDTFNEDVGIINERFKLCDKYKLKYSVLDYYNNKYIYDIFESCILKESMENYTGFEHEPSTNLLSKLFRTMKRSGNSIYLTGLAGDEITTNYTFQLQKQASKQFTWEPTYDTYESGEIINEIDQHEYIGEVYGVEVRYPFMDKKFIQAFLNLTERLKVNYKSVTTEYLKINGMCYSPVKTGFSLKSL